MIIQVAGYYPNRIKTSTRAFTAMSCPKDKWSEQLKDIYCNCGSDYDCECEEDTTSSPSALLEQYFKIKYKQVEDISSKFMTPVPDNLVVYYANIELLHLIKPDILIHIGYGGINKGGLGFLKPYGNCLLIDLYRKDSNNNVTIKIDNKAPYELPARRGEELTLVKPIIDEFLESNPGLLRSKIDILEVILERLDTLEKKLISQSRE